MNWYYYFEDVPGKDEYFITHKQCGICKLTKQEHCEGITGHLCMMDYYTFEMRAQFWTEPKRSAMVTTNVISTS